MLIQNKFLKLLQISLFFTIASPFLCSEEQTKEQIENKAHDKFESGFEQTGVGLIEVGVGLWRASEGDVAGCVGSTADGLRRMKNGYRDFKESKSLYHRARDMDSNSNQSPSTRNRGNRP